MNEKILELVNEANKDIGYTFKMEEAKQLHELVEKFSKLLIKECADLCVSNIVDEICGGKGFSDKIKKHFGVEE